LKRLSESRKSRSDRKFKIFRQIIDFLPEICYTIFVFVYYQNLKME